MHGLGSLGCLEVSVTRIGDSLDVQCHELGERVSVDCRRLGERLEVSVTKVCSIDLTHELFLAYDGDFFLVDGSRFNVLKAV